MILHCVYTELVFISDNLQGQAILVGNKGDLREQRKIDYHQSVTTAEKLSRKFIEQINLFLLYINHLVKAILIRIAYFVSSKFIKSKFH